MTGRFFRSVHFSYCIPYERPYNKDMNNAAGPHTPDFRNLQYPSLERAASLEASGRADEAETEALCASPIACAVADAWAQIERSGLEGMLKLSRDRAALDMWIEASRALELATRNNPLRKVLP